MEQAPSTSADRARGLQAAQAAATLLPAFAVGLPGGPLDGDLAPEWTAAGASLLLALPAGVLLLLRGASSSAVSSAAGLAWLALFLLAAGASLLWQPAVDTLGASRALQVLFTGTLMFLSGASLGPTGRQWLARGAVLFSAWLLIPAFSGAVPAAGALGNSGSTSEAALVGAVIGLWFFSRAPGLWRWCGGAAALGLAVYTGWAPALAGMLCLGLAIAVHSFLSLTGNQGRWRAAGLGLACVFVFGVAWVRTHAPFPTEGAGGGAQGAGLAGAPDPVNADPVNAGPVNEDPASADGEVDAAARDLLGGEVRLLIWRSVARMVVDYGVAGVGPGQFGAAFPPYRDPGEIAISSAPELGRETEVEHAHNDWLQGFADAGLGGLAWVLFLAAVGWRALRSLRDPELARAALSAATLAVLANALLRSPFSFNPASSLMFAVLGAVGARGSVPLENGDVRRPLRTHLVVVLASLVLILTSLPRAWHLVQHGRGLAGVFVDGDAGGLERALAACPDSPLARSVEAQFAKLTGAEEAPEQALARWERVLEVRPHRLVAWMEVGRLRAQAGEPAAARAAWSRAVALAPGHPVLCRNLARLEATSGDADAAFGWLEQGGDTSRETLLAVAADAVLMGSAPEAALALAHRADPDLPALTPQSAWNLAQTLEDTEPARARWLEGAAHLAWAREHRALGNLDTAARSYRQAARALWYRTPRATEPVVADGLLLELAGALAGAGRVDEARVELARVRDPAAVQRAPEWIRSALRDAGLDPGS